MLCMWKNRLLINQSFRKETTKLEKRFSDRHLEYKIRQRFDRRLNQYIADYENDSDDEYAAQYFDELAISSVLEIDIIKLIEFETNELFLITFDNCELQDIEFFINSLIDKTFQHRLIFIDIINAFINESFDFAYISITDSRYDDNEFKKILINCDAADRLTENMKQFKALQRISDVALNKKTIESSIKFEIDNTLILKFVELNISLEIITFHIIKINISFLLCVNDLNRLNIYFINLINQMISTKILTKKNVISWFDVTSTHFFYEKFSFNLSLSNSLMKIHVYWSKLNCVVYIVDLITHQHDVYTRYSNDQNMTSSFVL
jgi:hypothetical protein